MAQLELLAALPEILLATGSVIRFEAIDPTTGATVTGVVVSSVAIYDANESAAPVSFESPALILAQAVPAAT